MSEKAGKEILRGWKEIEDFLGMGRRAILRYGYPVHKEGGNNSSSCPVYALKQELLDYAVNKTPTR